MTMKLAHQSVPAPLSDRETASKKYVDDQEAADALIYFRWNHTGISQFTLIDPDAKGWTVAFVPATTFEAEHILLTAPPSWATSPGEVHLIVTQEMAGPDYQVSSVHGPMLDSAGTTVVDAEAGPLGRYVDSDNYVTAHYQVANVWDYPTDWAIGYKEAGWVTYLKWISHLPVYELSSDIIRSHMYVDRGIIGGGYNGPVLSSQLTVSDAALITDTTVGFGCFWMGSGVGGGEKIKIYDFVVRKAES